MSLKIKDKLSKSDLIKNINIIIIYILILKMIKLSNILILKANKTNNNEIIENNSNITNKLIKILFGF